MIIPLLTIVINQCLQPLGVHGRRLPGGRPPPPAAGLGVQTHFPGPHALRDAAGGTRGVARSPLAAAVRGRSLVVRLREGDPEQARREPRGRTARATEVGILRALSATKLWGHRSGDPVWKRREEEGVGGARDMRLKNKDDEARNGKKSNAAFHPCKQRLTPFSQHFLVEADLRNAA